MDEPITGNKLDGTLSAAHRAWAAHPELAPDAGMSIRLSYDGDLSDIEALGFEPFARSRTQAPGIVRFRDLPRLCAHPNVKWMAAGRRPQKTLEVAPRDIKARATAGITGPTADGIWQAPNDTGTLTSIPHGTGKGVIVAIMDSGIDYTHPMFMSQLTPTKKTRILKIWDQGLEPKALADCPSPDLLEHGKTYGVEITAKQIEDDLNGVKALEYKHRDCESHGTHVAGIAAGGPLFPAHGDATRIGVAPEADIIVVKWLDTPEHIFYRKPDGTADSVEVGWTDRYHDALLWCLRTAAHMTPNPKPVVINMSFGDPSYPGDGLDDDARWTDDRVDPNKPGDKKCTFPKGAIIVKTAGNEGPGDEEDPGETFTPTRRVARITIPHIEETILPLRLVEEREGETTREQCEDRFYSPSIGVHFWYRRAPAPLSVRFAMKFPNGGSWGAEVMVGGKLELGFNPIVGPPPNDIAMPFTDGKHRFTIDHQDIPAVTRPDHVVVHRHYVHFFLGPQVTGTGDARVSRYHPGIYEMRIRAPQDTVIYVLCDRHYWNAGRAFFQIAERTLEVPDRDLDPSEIKILEEFTSVDPLGRNVITVSAYNDTNGDATKARHHAIARFSSRGPLRDFADPSAPAFTIAKPDIAAPGVKINSSISKDIKPGPGIYGPWFDEGVRFMEFDGTSMAAPLVTGVVALLLEKTPTLNVDNVRTKLSFNPRPAADPAHGTAATNAYGAGMVDALTSHNHV